MDERLEDRIEEFKKNDKKFIDKILYEASDLKLKSVYNIILVVVGFISPSLPLLLLYKRDWLGDLGVTYSVLGCIIINAALVLMIKLILDMEDYIKMKNSVCKCENYNYFNKIIMLKLNCYVDKVSIADKKFIGIKSKFYSYLIKKMQKRIHKLDKLTIDAGRKVDIIQSDRNYYGSLIVGIILAVIIMLCKVLSVLFKQLIIFDFKYALLVMLLTYGTKIVVIIFNGIYYFYQILKKRSIILLLEWHEKNKKENSDMQQISFFEN